MKIVADENIPLVDYYFGGLGEVVLKPGRAIQSIDLIDADVLLVRSVTQVNQTLLQNSKVKFVGSTTIGIDHMDTEWLQHAGIGFSTAKGCNAVAVVEYVLSVLAALQRDGLLLQKKLRAGVIGVGEIGTRVAEKLKLIGFDVLLHDPIRAENEKEFISVSLDHFVDLDFITLHTPLTVNGPYPTYHLIEKSFLSRQKAGCVLLNTSRGSVVDFSELKQHGAHLIWCFDVWENEPFIDLTVMQAAKIATPHIAGYSVQSKYRGIEMIYQAALADKRIPDLQVDPIVYPQKKLFFSDTANWRDVILQAYDPMITSQEMKQILLTDNKQFDHLRKYFPERYEMAYLSLQNEGLTTEDFQILTMS